MNKYQRIVLVVTALAVFATWLFPPFVYDNPLGRMRVGHKFIGTEFDPSGFYHINYSLLALEWLGIVIIGVLVYFSLHKLK